MVAGGLTHTTHLSTCTSTSFISSASIWVSLWERTDAVFFFFPLVPLFKAETAWCRRAGPSWRRWGCGQEPWTDCWGWGCCRAAWRSGSKGTGRGWRGSRSKGCNSWSSGCQNSHTGSWRKTLRPRRPTWPRWRRPGCCRSCNRSARGTCGSARCSGSGSAAPSWCGAGAGPPRRLRERWRTCCPCGSTPARWHPRGRKRKRKIRQAPEAARGCGLRAGRRRPRRGRWAGGTGRTRARRRSPCCWWHQCWAQRCRRCWSRCFACCCQQDGGPRASDPASPRGAGLFWEWWVVWGDREAALRRNKAWGFITAVTKWVICCQTPKLCARCTVFDNIPACSAWWCPSLIPTSPPIPGSALYMWWATSAPESESLWPGFTFCRRRGWYLKSGWYFLCWTRSLSASSTNGLFSFSESKLWCVEGEQ